MGDKGVCLEEEKMEVGEFSPQAHHLKEKRIKSLPRKRGKKKKTCALLYLKKKVGKKERQ